MVLDPDYKLIISAVKGFSWLTIDPKPNLAATMMMVRTKMTHTIMSTVLIIIRKV